MDFIRRFLLYVSVTAFFCLLIGLYRPWVMLWWEDTQNRKKVIQVYGTAAVISYVLYWAVLLILSL